MPSDKVTLTWLDAGEVLADTPTGTNLPGWYAEYEGGYLPLSQADVDCWIAGESWSSVVQRAALRDSQ